MAGTSSAGIPVDHLCRKFSQVQQANRACDVALQNKLDNLKKEYFRNLRKSTDRIWRLHGTDTPPIMRLKPQRVRQRSVSVQDFNLPSAYNLKSLEKELTEVEDGEGDIRTRVDVRKQRYSLPARPSTAIPVRYELNYFETSERTIGEQTLLSRQRMRLNTLPFDKKTLRKNTLSEETTELNAAQQTCDRRRHPDRYRRKTWSAGEPNNLTTLASKECRRTGPAKSNICSDKFWQINNSKSLPNDGNHNSVQATKDTKCQEHVTNAEPKPDVSHNKLNNHEKESGRQQLETIIEDIKTSFADLQGKDFRPNDVKGINKSTEPSPGGPKMVRSKTSPVLLTSSLKGNAMSKKKTRPPSSVTSISASFRTRSNSVVVRSSDSSSPWQRASRDPSRRHTTSQLTARRSSEAQRMRTRVSSSRRSRKSGIFGYVNVAGLYDEGNEKQNGDQDEATSSLLQLQNCRYLRRACDDEETW
ncbi:PREDICTED: uncharacterized protein LOC109466218 [Branchiostoma belcheri]|uniref:Uncharacterized protein LOC109466218 n=1 Tax=Branchiostoma belcheri TaxID=7741 RepID=A0A6P4Y4W5_BRABE|nr:PREDICTED: uncharacterized protein LOC109466218 [Branchiostoma belcheri]